MILDITRHKFFEGLATLLLFAVVTAIVTGVSYIHLEGDTATAIAPLGALVSHLSLRHPILSVIAMMPIVVYAVLRLARATARASLYPQGTLAAIALGAITLTALLPSAKYAITTLVALLSCEAFGRLLYCFGPNIRAHYLFTATLALGTLPLVDGALIIFAGVVTILTIILRRTLRESILAVVGVSLPLLLCCYIEWLSMGSFSTPFHTIGEALLTPSYATILDYITLPRLIFLGVLAAVALLSVMLYFTNRVSLSISARNVWFVLLISVITLAITMLLGYISPSIVITLSVVIVPMLPMLFICTGPLTSVIAYLLFTLAAIVALM